MKPVYFLESINNSEELNSVKYISLFNASSFIENENIELSELFSIVHLNEDNIKVTYKSGFVNLDDGQIINANGSYVAKHYIYQNNIFRHNLIRNSTDYSDDNILSDDIFSYHINVGHGNCSFVIDKTTNVIIAIDCSNYDYTQRKRYQNNIDLCIDHIIMANNLRDFKITYFVLTHPHFDHYSGINELINKRIINNNTTFYLNAYYSMPSPLYNRTIQNIYNLGCKIIEPTSYNASNRIDIIYPHERMVKTNNTVHNHLNPIVDSNPNNASIVAKINGKSRSFTFTGDIETDGWDRVINCMPHIKCTNFIANSHHGSINGHLRSKCSKRINLNNISNCVLHNTTPIIMGRSGAYPGIPASKVIADFPNVIFSEKDNKGYLSKFVEIEWQTGIAKWH